MNEYVIAKYVRLSIEDEKTESMSIPHQQLMLDKHIDELDIPNAKVLEFVDNGYTGTNMERPAVQELLDLVHSGMVNCIITKDFSRFSRNSMDSEYFIAQVFPLYQVRFVSVGDRFDSNDYKNDTGGIDVAFKFLMHEYYSADLSKKVKSAKLVKMRSGENIVANAIYGYRKNDLGKWEPDPEAAEIVRQIFKLALKGIPASQIRDQLCAERRPTPREYINMKHGKDILPTYRWGTYAVTRILKNEQYIGSYVSGKQESKAVGSSSKNYVDKSEWIVIPDSHPPIVSKEDFKLVREILTRYKYCTTAKPVGKLLQKDENLPKQNQRTSLLRMPSNAIYGYVKDENGHLTIDPPAASVIQEMYQMAAQGLSFREIQDNLTGKGYPIPIDHIKLNMGYNITPVYQWTKISVCSILQNVQYTGAYVSGKILKNHETGMKYHTAQSDWIVIPDMNPAIVSKELFEEVQTLTAEKRGSRKSMCSREYLLRGIAKCGCCGHALKYYYSSANYVYRCYHTIGDPSAECYKMKVSAAELEETVLAIVKKQAKVVLNSDNLSELRHKSSDTQATDAIKKQIRQNAKQRRGYYERYKMEKIDREEYISNKADCTARIEKLNNQLAVIKKAGHDVKSSQKSAELAKEAISDSTTPRAIVNTLIEKVFVFPGDRIEIQWKIADFANDESAL